MYWSARTTVVPPTATVESHANSSLATFGDRPSDSSSTSSTLGWASRTRASASMRRSPPDSVPARWLSRLGSPRRGKAASAGEMSRRPIASTMTRRFSSTVRLANTARSSGTSMRPARARSSADILVIFLPRQVSDPDRSGNRPASTRSVLLLPAPLTPSNAVTLPAGTVRSRPCRTSMVR